MTTSNARVAVLLAPGRVELREEPVPEVPAGGLVVRVRCALTDGTDLKAYRRGHPQMPPPTRFGHEFAGDVVAVGSGVTGFAVGDAVACVHSAPCATCFWCLRGEEELCATVMETKILGAYADYVAVPAHIVARNCYRKPPDLSYREAAFLEPLACVCHSRTVLEKTGALASSARPPLVAIVGDGAFGILHALMLRAAGAEVVLIGRRPARLAIARGYGLAIVDAGREAPAARIAAATDGRGADAAVECTGNREAWESAPALVRRGGTVSFFGGLPSGTQVAFDAARLHYDEVRLIAPFHFTPRAVRQAYDHLAARAFDLAPLVDPIAPLAAIAEVFARLDRGEGMKAAIEP